MSTTEPYQVKKFNLSALKGISDQTLEMHFKLYEGYVKNTNQLTEEISGLIKGGKVEQEEMPMYSELKRRLGFEYNGMVLHEYYFGNLMKNGGGEPRPSSSLRSAIEDSFGSFEIWKADFASVGKMRGVGWAICYQDPLTQKLSNHWTSLHEVGNVAGFVPVLVMDVWEHAFLLDYQPSERGKYIEAFFSNMNWTVVEERLGGTLVRAQNV
ncbi:MAG: superoxide dismutase [Blastocatellia bacterium AA13]|nr:MAG: superoxide dismutase [Blastocatellia bacterium AA13]